MAAGNLGGVRALACTSERRGRVARGVGAPLETHPYYTNPYYTIILLYYYTTVLLYYYTGAGGASRGWHRPYYRQSAGSVGAELLARAWFGAAAQRRRSPVQRRVDAASAH